MEILRVPPYPIVTTWDVPEANAAYTIYVEDVVDHSYETVEVESNSQSKVTYTLPRSKVQFDRDFFFRIHEVDLGKSLLVQSWIPILVMILQTEKDSTTTNLLSRVSEKERTTSPSGTTLSVS